MGLATSFSAAFGMSGCAAVIGTRCRPGPGLVQRPPDPPPGSRRNPWPAPALRTPARAAGRRCLWPGSWARGVESVRFLRPGQMCAWPCRVRRLTRRYLDGRPGSVPTGVGEPLLDDPVRGQHLVKDRGPDQGWVHWPSSAWCPAACSRSPTPLASKASAAAPASHVSSLMVVAAWDSRPGFGSQRGDVVRVLVDGRLVGYDLAVLSKSYARISSAPRVRRPEAAVVPASGLADHRIGGQELRLGHSQSPLSLASTRLQVARAALLGPCLTTILVDLPLIWMPQKRSRSAVRTHLPFLQP